MDNELDQLETDAEQLEEELLDEQPTDEVEGQEEAEAAPQTDYDKLRAEFFAELDNRERRILEENSRRTRQSLDARMKSFDERVQERLQPVRTTLQESVKAGRMEAEDARQQLADLKDQFEAEEFANTNRQRAYDQAQQQVSPQPIDASQVVAQFNQIFASSGLSNTDPEVSLLPKQLGGTPEQAIEAYKQHIAYAQQVKQQRMAIAPPKPKKTPPTMEIKAGGQPAARNPIAGIEDPDELWKLAKKQGRIR